MKFLALFVGFFGVMYASVVLIQEQPHVDDPAECVTFCYPKGGPDARPKGVPDGVRGSECKGDRCGHINDMESEEEDPCSEFSGRGGKSCSTFCSKVCCSCLAACV